MGVPAVRAFFAEHAPDLEVLELDADTSTVTNAAAAHGVAPGQIAKTLAFHVGGDPVLLVARGDARIANAKMKAAFGGKARMLDTERVAELTGHPPGGVCPFALATPLPVYCDVQLRDFAVVLPAAGATNSAVAIRPDRLADLTGAPWVDVCQPAT
jgi:prolyl-tRNA editing enzyme YbaK/EbsC (Cys-tRNA(Pro) deacylase)